MTSSTLDCTQDNSSLSTSAVSLYAKSTNNKQSVKSCISCVCSHVWTYKIDYNCCNYLPVVLLAILRTFEETRWSLPRILSTVRQGPWCGPPVRPVGETSRWGDVLELFCWNTQSLVRSVDSFCQTACCRYKNTALILCCQNKSMVS